MKKHFLLIAVLVAALGVGAVKADELDDFVEWHARAEQGDADALC